MSKNTTGADIENKKNSGDNPDDTNLYANIKHNGWQAIHVGLEQDGVSIDGLNLWHASSDWESSHESVELPHPAHPQGSLKRFVIYKIKNTNIKFAMTELSNGVYGFYQHKIKTYIYPSNKVIDISLERENNYTIGGEIYNLPTSCEYKVERATKSTKNKENITNILLKCIDDSLDSQLGFKMVSDEERYIDNTENLSARSYATLVITPNISIEEQTLLVKKANAFITEQRTKYNSLFLTNYRESNTIARKRISFELAFMICNNILCANYILGW